MEDLGVKGGFWNGRKVLVTGHTGFKGSWLTLMLHLLGARVTGYSLAPLTSPNIFQVASIESVVESVIEDIRDLGKFREVVQRTAPDIVFHLAAQALVQPSYHDPITTYSTNVMGTANVLEALRSCPSVRAIVVITSDKCYENREWLWGYREDESMGGFDPYSSSKGCAELIISAYRRSFFLNSKNPVGIASARAGNVIGGGDWSDKRLVPDILSAVASDTNLELRYPNSVRPWQHVLEPLIGYIMLARRLYDDPLKFSEAFNFGPSSDDNKSVREVVRSVLSWWGPHATSVSEQGNQDLHEAGFLRLDSTKAREVLGWHPQLDFDSAIGATVAWHRAYLQGQDMHLFTKQQIQDRLGRVQ